MGIIKGLSGCTCVDTLLPQSADVHKPKGKLKHIRENLCGLLFVVLPLTGLSETDCSAAMLEAVNSGP